MSDTKDIIGQIILWTVNLVGVFVFYLFIKNLKPNIFYKGWGDLNAHYSVTEAAVPKGVKMDSAWIRVGSETYNGTIQIGIDTSGIYIQRSFLSVMRGILYIPYKKLKLVEPPHKGVLNLPVYGIFRVDNVDIWIGPPYADQIIEHLPKL